MNPSKPRALLRSLLFSYILSGILLIGLAFVLYKLKIKEAQINAAVYIIYIISCLIGGFFAGHRIRQRRFFWGMLSGLLYFIVLFTVSWILKDSGSFDMSRVMTVMACCLAGGTAGGMMS